jgi:putative hydrolase of the HAD superfamily
VGDRLRTDAIGATEAGMTGVWLDRGAAEAPPADVAAARRLGIPVLSALDGLATLLLERTEAA